MDWDDIGSYSVGERARRNLKNFYGKTGSSPDLMQHEIDHSHQIAQEEMLDEIHFMLRQISKALIPEAKTSSLFGTPDDKSF